MREPKDRFWAFWSIHEGLGFRFHEGCSFVLGSVLGFAKLWGHLGCKI